MALVLSVVQSCGMCFSERCLRSVITFEAERGYRNTLFNKMRFKNFLLSGVSKLCSPLQHKIAENILEEVCKYDAASATDRSKLLHKITDLPPGRLPVETYIIEANDIGFERVYQMITDELEAGGKVYLVYPVIEQSEHLPQLRAVLTDFEAISNRFEGYNCGLLHGKMKRDKKDEALRQFRSGELRILFSTQVIEIGVDVPDASMMVVMNAERFGIAQLHQLRGRVGRGVRKSKCLLLASTASGISRLKVMEKSSDGFYLANVDLLLRGPGDLLGKKQSGHLPEFPIARLEIDGNILQEAHLAALKILGVSHDLQKFPELKAELSMRHPLSVLGD